jgi:hypothetical protein
VCCCCAYLNIWPISKNNDVGLDRAKLVYAILKGDKFYFCTHVVPSMIEALPFGGLITKIINARVKNIPVGELVNVLSA